MTATPGAPTVMDLAKQTALIDHVRERGGAKAQVAVTLEQFFEGPDDEWPYASGVAVITTLQPEEVDALTAAADTEPSGGPAAGADWLVDAPAVPDGHHYVGVWWD
jgi:hypothetical protein